ncbi:hypothetical protein EJB05_21613, partial [Eragrostis curvula]
DLFVAGADTSSTTVEWAMAELLQSPQVMKKVKGELRELLGMKMQVEESDIGQLPYLQAVVKEVLRLHSPVAMTLYRAEATIQVQGKDCKLIPFGGGRRICLGLPLAYRTAHLILALLLHQFDWKLPEEATENCIDMTEKFGLVVSWPLH